MVNDNETSVVGDCEVDAAIAEVTQNRILPWQASKVIIESTPQRRLGIELEVQGG